MTDTTSALFGARALLAESVPFLEDDLAAEITAFLARTKGDPAPMATRTDNDLALPHALAVDVREMLNDYASAETDHANRTRSAAVREHCRRRAARARELAGYISARLYSWADNS